MTVDEFFNKDNDLSSKEAKELISALKEREFVLYQIAIKDNGKVNWIDNIYLFDGYTYWDSDMYGVPSSCVCGVLVIE